MEFEHEKRDAMFWFLFFVNCVGVCCLWWWLMWQLVRKSNLNFWEEQLEFLSGSLLSFWGFYLGWFYLFWSRIDFWPKPIRYCKIPGFTDCQNLEELRLTVSQWEKLLFPSCSFQKSISLFWQVWPTFSTFMNSAGPILSRDNKTRAHPLSGQDFKGVDVGFLFSS